MDEIQIKGAAAEEEIGDDFYEKIEAPKFVDLTAPDRCRTEDDDGYWFCHRVGCDQKHEEEMDSEAIYKNFVLRVMAARSPNVRLRKALKDASSTLQCPRTVPAKSSKSRVSRLAMISSISQKMGEAKAKVRPSPKQNATTPNVKAAKQASAKALTTPKNKKGLSNPGTFRSLGNPKPTTIEVPKCRVVAKALVFHSPKKIVKLKKSVELSSSLRKICAEMKKLDITDASKKNALGCNRPLDSSRKQLRGREVKSRVYDSLNSQNQKNREAKSLKCLKKKNKEKDLQLSRGPMSHEGNERDSTDKEIEAKSNDGSLEVCSTSGTCKNPSESLEQTIDEKVKISSLSNSGDNDAPNSQTGGHNERNERISPEENIEPCSKDKEIPEAVESDDKENSLGSHSKLSESKVMENDDKENTSAFDENRKLNCTTRKLVKKDVLGRHETSKSIQKVNKLINKTSKENSTSAVNSTQGMKYRKPKPTNPKPFRLRTDERGILKEANLEKKHFQAPLKETTTVPGSQTGNLWRKHQNVQRNEKCLGQIETVNCALEGIDNESDTRTLKGLPQTMKTSCSRISKGAIDRKLSTTPQKPTVPMHQKTKLEKTAQKSEGRLEKINSPSIKPLVRPRGVASSRKTLVSNMKPGQLGVIKQMSPTMSRTRETSDPDESGTSLATKPQGRRHTTIPKEPNFHSIHVPKSCTRRVL
ncbi:uncharacterized protein LOC110428678 isoform X2 [Herrania umbratica]|uniref:Uncharacterized protein LOC110428678 isoform X2 n=1 Tax=Herrania umbratica TaxID=108875 RepID=A0A6J1BL13_9ROSI|nr:uncharacterized protein LOC110428678 isoform X2 [Herrania umbratica]